MNNKVKIPLIIGITVVALALIAVIIYYSVILSAFAPAAVSKDAMEKELTKNMESITAIIAYAQTFGNQDVDITDTDYIYSDSKSWHTIYVSSDTDVGEPVTVTDANVLDTLDYLFKQCHYQNINKSGNTIYLQRWAAIRYKSAGIAYSLNGEEPKIDYATKIEPLSEKDWYYYETDVNAWKAQNQ